MCDESARPSPVESELKPVAWRWRLDGLWKPGEWSYGPSEPLNERPRYEHVATSGWSIEPLYTHPTPLPSVSPDIEGLQKALADLVDFIKINKRSVLEGMTKRETGFLMDALHAANQSLNPQKGEAE